MSVPQVELEKVWGADDHAEEYARRNLDREWEAYKQREAARAAAGQPTTEVRGAPGQGTEQPSALKAGATAATETAKAGVTAIAEGMFEDRPGQMLYGGMALASALPAGLGAAVQQALKNWVPGMEAAEAIPGGQFAGELRTLLATPGLLLDPEQQKRMREQPIALEAELSGPITYGELSNILSQIAAPLIPKGVKTTARAVQEQLPNVLSERGSIGPPPAGGEFRGARTPGEVPKPEPAAAPVELPKVPEGAEARINLARQIAPDSAKQVMVDISKIISDRPEIKASRRTVGHAETIAEAAKWTLADVLKVAPGDLKLSDVRGFQLAARDYFNAATHHLDDLVKRIKAGDPAAEAQWAVAEVTLERLAMLAEMPGTELGRALESRAIEATVARVPGYTPEVIAKLAALRAGTDVPPRVAAAQYAALPTQAQRHAWLKQKWQALVRGKDIAHELWINNLLTNPQTHAANVLGTGLTIGWNIPETWVAEIVNKLFTRDANGVQRGEAAAQLRAIPQALSDGIRLSQKTLAKELGREVTFTGTEQALISQGRVEVTQQLPSVLRIPTIALGIEDAAGKGISYRMELSALALRQARAEGKIGPALEARVKDLETNPPAPLVAEAVDAAMLRTLNAELGPAGQTFMRWANQVPGGRLILPFIRTPTNSAKWFSQRAPILGQLSAQNWADMMAGGAARDKAIARQALGAAVTAVILWEVAQGNITGDGDPNKALRSIEQPVKPRNSICIGGTCYGYSRTDPVGGLIGLIATYGEITSRIPTQDDYEQWAAYSEALALAVGTVMVNKTYMRGLADVLEAMKDPQRNVGQVASGWARSIVPAGLRAVTRQMDDNVLRESRGLLEEIKAGIPYWAEDIPPARNPITGEPVRFPPGWGPDLLSPIYITEKSNDPVLHEIVNNRIVLSPVPRYVGPGERSEGPQLMEPRGGVRAHKLTPRQHDRWIDLMTHEKMNGRTLHEALTDLVTSAKYQSLSEGPGGSRELMIKTTYEAYKKMGAAMLLAESPTLRPAIEALMQQKALRLLPKTDPRSPQYRSGPAPALGR